MTDNQSSPSNAATNSAAPDTVGALLRQNRERAGLGIADVARVLRISQKYLEALEDARHEDLPGMPYAIGFVRSYAEHLHLDSEEVVRRYKDEAAGVNGKNDLVFPKPIADGGVPGGAVLGLGVLIAAVAYGVWYWNANQADMEMEIARVEAVPEHMAAKKPTEESSTASASEMPVSEPPVSEAVSSPDPQDTVVEPADEPAVEPVVESAPMETALVSETPVEVVESESAPTVAEPVAPSVADPVEQPVEDTPAEEIVEEPVETVVAVVEAADEAPAEPVVESAVEATPEVETPQAAPEATPEPAVQDVESVAETPAMASVAPQERQNDGPSRITVRAKSNSWIQVRDEIADRLLFTRLLREGDEYQVPDRDGLRLMTGNAGALELLVDGSAVPSIGDVGEVRRNVELDADKLQNGSAVTE